MEGEPIALAMPAPEAVNGAVVALPHQAVVVSEENVDDEAAASGDK